MNVCMIRWRTLACVSCAPWLPHCMCTLTLSTRIHRNCKRTRLSTLQGVLPFLPLFEFVLDTFLKFMLFSVHLPSTYQHLCWGIDLLVSGFTHTNTHTHDSFTFRTEADRLRIQAELVRISSDFVPSFALLPVSCPYFRLPSCLLTRIFVLFDLLPLCNCNYAPVRPLTCDSWCMWSMRPRCWQSSNLWALSSRDRPRSLVSRYEHILLFLVVNESTELFWLVG